MVRQHYISLKSVTTSIILVVVMLMSNVCAAAEDTFAQKVNLVNLSMTNGLPYNYVDNIIKDSKGYIWIATNGGGLSRYDGYNFKTFDISTPETISSNFVHDMVEDNNGRLWIASDCGIDIYDLRAQRMVKDDICGEEEQKVMDSVVSFVSVDGEGVVWYASGEKVYAAITSSSDGMVKIVEYVCKNAVTALACIEGSMWYADNSGLYKLVCNGHIISTERLDATPEVDALLKRYMVTALYRKDNELWIGTDGGLVRFNPLSRMYKYYESDPKNLKSLSQNRITDIVETGTHNIIISTLKGLNVYNPLSDDFEQITQDTWLGQKHLACNFVNCLMVDDDLLWVGTEIGGADVLIPNELAIKNYAHTNNPASLAPNPVNAIKEDNEGNLWVGTVESGLSMKRLGSDVFEHFTVDNGLVHNSISALDIDDENHLWAGTWGNGVCVIDLNRKNYPVIRHIPELEGKYVGAIVADHANKSVWVSTTDTIYCIEKGRVRKPIGDKRMNNMGGAIGGAIDDHGNLWLGTEGGLLIVDLSTSRLDSMLYEVIDKRLDDPSETGRPRVTYIYKAKDGTMFVGTNGYGLSFRRPDEKEFSTLTQSNGLANNSVKGIAEDAQGNIWVSTYRGLSVFDMKGMRVTSYSTADGLMDDNFYWNASCVSPATGTIYLGTLSGLTEVRRRASVISQQPMSPTITALRVLNADIESECDYISEGVSYASEMQIHERDKSFTVEFSALNYRTPKSVVYSYKLVGFDSQWTDVMSDRRIATYTNLPSGQYELQIRCTDGHGNWSDMKRLKIEVKPFFYKTMWFYLLVLTVIILVVWQIFHYRVKTLKEQRRLLNMLVKERTEELERQNKMLESQKHILEENTRELEEKSEELEMQKETLEMQKKILEDNTKELEEKSDELEQQNIILGDQNIQITRQKDSIEQMAEKIQKLSFDKLQFFTNISHEIRTPITLIMGPTKRALSMTDDPKMIEQLKLVEKSSHNLLEIVNQLMDFRKIETENMDLKPTSGKIVPFIKDIIHPFAVYASERNIRVECVFRMKSEIIQFDTDALNKVLTNLLSNAIKYTNDSGLVTVYVATLNKDGKQDLYICVRDTGEGIAEDELEHIFESYYQGGNHKKAFVYGQTGTGIGLYLCRKLVSMAGGTIWAKNNRSKGCSMRILTPYEDGEILADNVEQTIEDDIEDAEMQEEEKKHILVVEDNKDMRIYIRSILEGTYEVYEAQNGVEGLTVLAENDIDFIICDLMMPVMDGLEFAKKVKSNFSFSHVHILMLTAQMADSYRTESYKIGVESYLHKPFDEQMLLARISGILASRKENQQRFQYSLNTDDLNIDRESEDEKFVKQVLELVEQNYKDSEYSIEDILKSMCCSKSMLNKKMQNVIGQSPGVFIRSYRLNMAKQLILLNRKTKSMNISQIAYDVGFNDPKYFTRCFTKHFCVTPSVLMEGCDNDEDIKE